MTTTKHMQGMHIGAGWDWQRKAVQNDRSQFRLAEESGIR